MKGKTMEVKEWNKKEIVKKWLRVRPYYTKDNVEYIVDFLFGEIPFCPECTDFHESDEQHSQF
jgi:hypothetical protein